MRWEDLDKEPCSLARTLSVVGDRWTLMVLRDCFLGVRRFEQFEERLGITRHVLANRLKKLVQAGVLKKVPYQERPRRMEYRLTASGVDLYPVILALVQWGDRNMASDEGPALVRVHRGCGQRTQAVFTCSECGEPLEARDIRVEPAPGRDGDGLLPVRQSS